MEFDTNAAGPYYDETNGDYFILCTISFINTLHQYLSKPLHLRLHQLRFRITINRIHTFNSQLYLQ